MKTLNELLVEVESQYVGHEEECTLTEFVEALADNGAADGHSYFAYLFEDESLAYASYWDLNQEQKDFWNDLLDSLDDYTFDVVFEDDNDSNAKGWHTSYQECLAYINNNNGTDNSYFGDYKGGTVSIICNDSDRVIYSEDVR